jgi:hypothetical protein
MNRLFTLLTLGAFMSGARLGQAADKPLVVDVWPGKAPGEIGNIDDEKFWDKRPDGNPLPDVGGKPVKWLTNVSKPTITVYRPAKDKDTGAAMVICPGGGLTYLAWDVEGEEVAAWLNSIGITGIILKYRVPRRPDQLDAKFRSISHIRPLQDGQRAMSLVRSKAAEWGLDPKRIGMIGFSAAAGVTIWTATNFEKRAYEPIDEIDKISCRPDFAVPLYNGGGAIPGKDKANYELTPGLRRQSGAKGTPIFRTSLFSQFLGDSERSMMPRPEVASHAHSTLRSGKIAVFCRCLDDRLIIESDTSTAHLASYLFSLSLCIQEEPSCASPGMELRAVRKSSIWAH